MACAGYKIVRSNWDAQVRVLIVRTRANVRRRHAHQTVKTISLLVPARLRLFARCCVHTRSSYGPRKCPRMKTRMSSPPVLIEGD